MKPKPDSMRHPWIAVNIVLFSLYAVFDAASFFWPRIVDVWWIIILYAATVFVNGLIVFGLITRFPRTNYLVAFVSFLMVVHLLVFIAYPLGLSLAYLGPSRAFYSLFITVMSAMAEKGMVGTVLLAFNIVMTCVHGINVIYFIRRPVAALFRGPVTHR